MIILLFAKSWDGRHLYLYLVCFYSTLIPNILQTDGLKKLHAWLKVEVQKEKNSGVDISVYGSSKIVQNRTPDQDKM